MHNAAFQAMRVDAVYRTFPLKDKGALEIFMKSLKEKDCPIFGLNVTIPYKEKVMEYTDSVDPLAMKIGAINTLMITHQRKIFGFNTDGPGFLAHLTELKFATRDKHIMVIGAGGTARAILCVLCLINDRPRKITLYNRTFSKAQALVNALQPNMDARMIETVRNLDGLKTDMADCLINTTPVGLGGEEEMPVTADALHSKMLVYDVIYNPSLTPLLKAARDQGAQISNGLGLLYYQGVLALQHWAGVDIEDKYKKIMRRALEKQGGS